jgi:hypothetical protein
MNKLKQLISETLQNYKVTDSCKHCNTPPLLVESKQYNMAISEAMRYHIDSKIQLTENIYRPGSFAHQKLLTEARMLWSKGIIELQGTDKKIFEQTDIGRWAKYEGEFVPLDLPLMEILTEAKYQGKEVALGKPKRGGSKKFYVYVKDGDKVKKISFGMAGGALRAKLNNPKARKAFSDRMNCPQAKDKTKAKYWSCRLPRYAKLLGFKTTFTGYW